MSRSARRVVCCVPFVFVASFALSLFLLSDRGIHRAVADDAHSAVAPTAGPSSDEAQKMLLDGNGRYVDDKSSHPHRSAERRTEVAQGQKPFAVILACADSRVAPEVVFDTGLGDLFVVRVAGNVTDDVVLGSIEYAVEHLKSPLVVVMGHERCGAVKAAVDAGASTTPAPGHIGSLITAIKPAVDSEKPTPADTLLDRVMVANVRHTVTKIREDEIVAELAKEGKVKVVGGRYDLDSGEFKLIELP